MTPGGVVFDLDGVLVDSERVCYELALRVAREAGADLPESAYAQFVGAAPSEFWAWMRDHFALKETTEQLLDNKQGELLEWYRTPVWMPGAMRLVESLTDAGVPCAVASSSPRSFIEAALSAGSLEARIRVVVSVDDPDLVRPKPNPDVYLQACRKLRIEPARCVAIEDSPTGALAAQSAGLRVIVAPNEWTRGESFPSAVERVEGLEALIARAPNI
ncbi:MAG: HAD family hydrolase [Actinomycetota bacterium]